MEVSRRTNVREPLRPTSSSGSNRPMPSTKIWTKAALEEWVKSDFTELPPDYVDASLAYPTEQSMDAQDWYNYFKRLEGWMKMAEMQYRKDRDFFFDIAPQIMDVGLSMMRTALELYQTDCNKFTTREVDRRLWQAAVYDIIYIARCRSRNPTVLETFFYQKIFFRYMEKMVNHFKSFITLVEESNHLRLDNVWSREVFYHNGGGTASESAPIDLCYRLRIYVGDMFRYLPHKYFMHRAIEQYEMARYLRPNNGRAYYQKGVLSMISEEDLTAMYNFSRALFASVSVERAKIDMLGLHDKSFKERLANRTMYWYHLAKHVDDSIKRRRRFRREIWLLPEQWYSLTVPPRGEVAPPNKKQHVENLSTSDLYSRFAVTLMLALGKVFSHIGMDDFPEVAEENLVYFEGLLNRKAGDDNPLNFNRMMEVVGLVMLVISNAAKESKLVGMTEEAKRTQFKHDLKMGVLYMLELFSIVVSRLSKLVYLLDWDNAQSQYLSASVLVWCLWLGDNVKCWAIPHVRPIFSISRIERSQMWNWDDTEDDVWSAFALLMTRIEKLLKCGRKWAFPEISEIDGNNVKQQQMSKLPELFLLNGSTSCMTSKWYTEDHYMDSTTFEEARAHLLLRLYAIHAFGEITAMKKIKYLKHFCDNNGVKRYESNTKLLIPRDAGDSSGLHQGNYWLWISNFYKWKNEAKTSKRKRCLLPDCNNKNTIILKRKRRKRQGRMMNGMRLDCPIPMTETNKLWCLLRDNFFNSDMVVIARRVVVDTNCLIGKLEWVEKLLHMMPNPLYLPITVILELKGLRKGGFKLRDRHHAQDMSTEEAKEKLKRGNEVAQCAQLALDFIEKNIKYIRTITCNGRTSKLSSIFDHIRDESYDPTIRNDNRILLACANMEINDKEYRKTDTPLRLFRRTVLISGDRGLHVKGLGNEIPTKDIESMVYWLASQQPSSEIKKFMEKNITPRRRRKIKNYFVREAQNMMFPRHN